MEYDISKMLYHGVSTNVLKFMSILKHGILSIDKAQSMGLVLLKSHKSSTSGNNNISLAMYNTRSFDWYIRPGISFAINLDSAKHKIIKGEEVRGALHGEVYSPEPISVKNIQLVLINDEIANKKLLDLDLCDLDYGSAEMEDKIKYVFYDNEEYSLEIINCYKKANKEFDKLTARYFESGESPYNNPKFNQEKNEIYKQCVIRCSMYLIVGKLEKHFGDGLITAQTIGEMTLSEFVKICLQSDAKLKHIKIKLIRNK